MTSSQPEPPVGLRERKKARTRDAIQRHALRLFSEHGYAETTVEQIAEAAEVSPSTFFRYYPTKEETVIYDRLDPLMIASFLRQPPELTPLQATRAALRETFAQTTVDESETESMRYRVFFRVPALRARLVERIVDTMWLLADAVAERVGCARDDPRVNVFTGALLGAVLAAVFSVDPGESDNAPPIMSQETMKHIDEALELLEGGLPFEHGNDR